MTFLMKAEAPLKHAKGKTISSQTPFLEKKTPQRLHLKPVHLTMFYVDVINTAAPLLAIQDKLLKFTYTRSGVAIHGYLARNLSLTMQSALRHP